MSLPLVNLVSIALTAVSLLIFLAALRKARHLALMSNIMAQQVAHSAANLQQALAILQAERENCHDESVRLEARLRDSDRVRSEISRAIELVELAKIDLKDNVRPAPSSVQAAAPRPAAPVSRTTPATSTQPVVSPRALPVFVNRIVRSTDLANAAL
jgi:biopolymer transport protein ExbB/TolQ